MLPGPSQSKPSAQVAPLWSKNALSFSHPHVGLILLVYILFSAIDMQSALVLSHLHPELVAYYPPSNKFCDLWFTLTVLVTPSNKFVTQSSPCNRSSAP